MFLYNIIAISIPSRGPPESEKELFVHETYVVYLCIWFSDHCNILIDVYCIWLHVLYSLDTYLYYIGRMWRMWRI